MTYNSRPMYGIKESFYGPAAYREAEYQQSTKPQPAQSLAVGDSKTKPTIEGFEKTIYPQPGTKQELMGAGVVAYAQAFETWAEDANAPEPEPTPQYEAVTFTVNNDVAIWQKDVSSINLPAIFGLKLTATVKNDAQLDDVSISNIYPTAQNIYVEGISKDGKKLWSKNIDPRHNTSASTSTTGAKLVEYLSVINIHGGFLNASFSVDKDGKEIEPQKPVSVSMHMKPVRRNDLQQRILSRGVITVSLSPFVVQTTISMGLLKASSISASENPARFMSIQRGL